MAAVIALAQLPFPVLSVKEERILEPISGSNENMLYRLL